MRFDDPVDLGTAQIRVLEPDGSALADVGRADAPERRPDGDRRDPARRAWGTAPARSSTGSRPRTGTPCRVRSPSAWGWAAAPRHRTPWRRAAGRSACSTASRAGSRSSGSRCSSATAFFVGVCWPGGLRRPRARALFWGGGAALGAATATSLLLYTPYASGGTLAGALDLGAVRTTLDTRVGGLLAARLVVLVLLVLVAAAVLRRVDRAAGPDGSEGPGSGGGARETVGVGGPRGGSVAAVPAQVRIAAVTDLDEPEPALAGAVAAGVLVGGGALAATWSLATHSAVGPGLAIALPVDVAHLLAMSVWLGGLPVLLAVLLPSRDVDALDRTVPMFSRIAGVCVASLVLTGIYQAWRQVGSPSALTGTSYGGVLLVKVAAVAVVVGLGAKARTWTGSHVGVARAVGVGRRPRPAGPDSAAVGRFRRIVAAESAIAVVILGLTASLVSLQPARSAHAADVALTAAAAAPVAVPVADAVEVTLPLVLKAKGKSTKGWVSAEVSPAAGGLPNELHVSVLDPKGAPLAVGHVFVMLRVRDSAAHSEQFPLTSTGSAGHYFAAFNVPRPDKFEFALTVHGTDGKTGVVRVPVDAR